MRQGKLSGLRVAILATDASQSELRDPRKSLNEAGATTEVVSPNGGELRGWNHKEWGQNVSVDRTLQRMRIPRTTTRCCCPVAS